MTDNSSAIEEARNELFRALTNAQSVVEVSLIKTKLAALDNYN